MRMCSTAPLTFRCFGCGVSWNLTPVHRARSRPSAASAIASPFRSGSYNASIVHLGEAPLEVAGNATIELLQETHSRSRGGPSIASSVRRVARSSS